MDKMSVIRVRCNSCEKTFTVLTTKDDFRAGQEIDLTCKDLKPFYANAKGCDEKLRFVRCQGKRDLLEGDVNMDKIIADRAPSIGIDENDTD